MPNITKYKRARARNGERERLSEPFNFYVFPCPLLRTSRKMTMAQLMPQPKRYEASTNHRISFVLRGYKYPASILVEVR